MSKPLRVSIHWPRGSHLRPKVHLHEELPFDEVEVRAANALAYAWLDACYAAATAGEPQPHPETALTDAQRRTIRLFVDQWSAIERTINSYYPEKVRPKLEWGGVSFSTEEKDGQVYVEVSGHYAGDDHGHYSEHGVGAVLLGPQVLAFGERGPTWVRTGKRPPKEPLRPHPEYNELSLQAVRDYVARRDFGGLRDAIRSHDGVEAGLISAAAEVERWLFELPPIEAAAQVPAAAFLLRRLNRHVDETSVKRSLVLMRALVDAKAYRMPDHALARCTDPESASRWAALGAKVNPWHASQYSDKTPLWVHRNRPEMVEALFELGANPRGLVDEFGQPYEALPAQTMAVLRRRHPEIFHKDPTPRPVPQVLSDWVERGWIEPEEGVDAVELNKLLASLLSMGWEADKVMDALIDMQGVEEVYVSDDELLEFLLKW
ncbi:MAG: hypothetical protein KC912_07840 [Proteobacteria bacterium]|nr:hypothetical protein [Pseudomonadota bacterium]